MSEFVRIECIQSHKAYLPELTAYKRYFQSKGHSFVIRDYPGDSHSDLLWRFMGFDRSKVDIPVIHEYSSLSLAPFARVKDAVKRHYNDLPEGRIFLNPYVRQRFGFSDGTPALYRDMGVSKTFFQTGHVKKEFDYVYIGEISRTRTIDRLCWHFQKVMKESSLLLIGEPEVAIFRQYGQTKNITFTGRLSYDQIPSLAAQAVRGVNVTPDIYPYSWQTSTKLLEYCALGLDVVTTNGAWVKNFCQKRQGSFFFVDSDLSNLTKEHIDQWKFLTPSVEDLEWNQLLESIGLNDWVTRIVQ